jgi:hypothetical protein
VVTNEPGDSFGFGRRHAKTRADVCGDLLPGDRMTLVAALGDIVKKRGDIESPAVLTVGKISVASGCCSRRRRARLRRERRRRE